MARWLDFFPEYEFTITNKTDTTKRAANFLSQYGYAEPPLEDEDDENELLLIVFGDYGDLEHHLLAVRCYLMFTDLDSVDIGLKNLLRS